jgi:predicted nucleotidyltransferase
VTSAEQRVVDVVRERLGAVPVVLCGSRAAGNAMPASDYDVVVGLPRRRILTAVRALPALAQALTAELGAPVSLNPVPLHVLNSSQPNLLAWKIKREGRFLAPQGESLRAAPVRPPEARARFSYLVSAIEYLLEDLDQNLRPVGSRGSHKALLHLVQLRLMETGRYASRLDEALAELEDAELTALCDRIDGAPGWFVLRDALVGELAGVPRGDAWRRSIRVNSRYVILSALRGSSRVAAACSMRAIDERLGDGLVALTRAVRDHEEPDPAALRCAASAIPAPIRPSSRTWQALHEVIRREWPAAHPLLAQ